MLSPYRYSVMTESDGDLDSSIQWYKTPENLQEFKLICTAGEKPLYLAYFFKALGFTRTLVFTSSVDTTHRLAELLKIFGGMSVGEYSSNISAKARHNVINQFKSGALSVLVCSDAMARGIDFPDVQHVISYDAPVYVKTYVHRVGRTARAGRPGCAYTFLRKEEVGVCLSNV